MEPSAPVCSDGVTIDVTPPEITAVSIKVFINFTHISFCVMNTLSFVNRPFLSN